MSSGPPKGILKNRTARSSEGNGGSEGYAGYGSGSSGTSLGSGWGSFLTSPSPRIPEFSASGLQLEAGSDRALLRSKMHEFVSRKRDLLFRPLGSDEIPILERGVQGNTKDHFGVTPSLDFFLKSQVDARRSHFFNTAQPGEIVVGELCSKTATGLSFTLLSMEGSRCLFLEDLDIKGYCPVSQMIPAIHPANPNKIFGPGDLVRLEILSVKLEGEKVVVGMKGNALSMEMKHSAQLGLVLDCDNPTPYKIGARERKLKLERSYEELLDASHGFHNPNGIACLASQMGILNNRNTMMTGLRGVFPESETASFLRRQQNGKWAHGNVAEGIRHFKSGHLTEAFQCLNKALSIDAENVEGLVARGALYANKGGYDKAIDDFQSALKHNPNHYNATKYLAETLVALGKQQEEGGKTDEAVGSYGKCLTLRPDHQEAKDALWAIYSRYEKVDFTKLNPLQRGRVIDLKEKIKTFLSTDLKSPVTGVNSDSKSRKRKDSSTSSSDSDEKGRKKKKKRKSKKRKSKKEESPATVGLAQALSPFSRRLAEGSGNIIPTREDQGWGTTKLQSSAESDKKRKKERRRKKRHSSDSSSSSSSSSSDSDRKSKKKKKASIEALGDLEAKLSAYFSKVEQEKIKEVAEPHPPSTVQVVRRDLSFPLDSHTEKSERKEPIVTRVLPTSDSAFSSRNARTDEESLKEFRLSFSSDGSKSRQGGIPPSGKIELRTDVYGNFLNDTSQTIVRTILNPGQPEEVKPKFEMKIRSQTQPLVPVAPGITEEGTKKEGREGDSKWRKIGDPNPTYTVTRLDGKVKDKPPPPFGSSIQPPQGTLYVPQPLHQGSTQPGREQHRNYRTNSSRSGSSSRSRSRSPKQRRRPFKHSNRGRSRSRSRSYGRRSRSRSAHRRFRGGWRGRFARGAKERTDRVRRVFLTAPPRGRRGRFQSRMRNVFAHSRSRTRSRSRSLSRSRRRSRSSSRSRLTTRKSRSPARSTETKSREKSKSPTKDKKEKEEPVEISVGSLRTTEASEVEKLLDQRKAEKKEEMKERNPDFFRHV